MLMICGMPGSVQEKDTNILSLWSLLLILCWGLLQQERTAESIPCKCQLVASREMACLQVGTLKAVRDSSTQKITWARFTCSDSILNSYNFSVFSVLPIYSKLIKACLRVWLYTCECVIPFDDRDLPNYQQYECSNPQDVLVQFVLWRLISLG